MNQTRIKICGITRREDASVAVALGADALGFVFYSGSPRYVTPEIAAAIVADLPPFLSVVGLFVNALHADILKTLALGFLNAVQLHGDETPAFCRKLLQDAGKPLHLIKAVRVATQEDLKKVEPYGRSVRLLDAKVAGQYGGTGQSLDWSLLKKWRCDAPLILAGGLHPGNVAMAIRQVQPYAVDVSSGVETEPGKKSAEKIDQFIQQVRQTDRQESK